MLLYWLIYVFVVVSIIAVLSLYKISKSINNVKTHNMSLTSHFDNKAFLDVKTPMSKLKNKTDCTKESVACITTSNCINLCDGHNTFAEFYCKDNICSRPKGYQTTNVLKDAIELVDDFRLESKLISTKPEIINDAGLIRENVCQNGKYNYQTNVCVCSGNDVLAFLNNYMPHLPRCIPKKNIIFYNDLTITSLKPK